MKIKINGEEFKLTAYDCSPVFVELGDKVETIDGTTHIENRKIKRSLSVKTIDLIRTDAYRLMQKLKNPYQTITYQDTISNTEETRIFILENSPSFTVKLWKNSNEYYAGTQLEFIEKGAE